MSKTCRICNQTKEETEFEKNRRVCKKCRSKQSYQHFNSDPNNLINLNQKRKVQRILNPEKSRQYLRNWNKLQER